MKNRKSYYTAFELFEANILIFKGSNFQISLGYLSILDMVTVNKYAFSHFFAICQTKILSNGLEISNRREGIFVWNQVHRRFAKWNLTTVNSTLFLNKQCYIQISGDLEESELDEINEEWEEEEEEKETTLERMSSNSFLIMRECWKGHSPPISETKIVGK